MAKSTVAMGVCRAYTGILVGTELAISRIMLRLGARSLSSSIRRISISAVAHSTGIIGLEKRPVTSRISLTRRLKLCDVRPLESHSPARLHDCINIDRARDLPEQLQNPLEVAREELRLD